MLLVVSAAVVCAHLGQKGVVVVVGLVPSLAGAPAHINSKTRNLLGGGKRLLRWSEDSAESEALLQFTN